MDTFPVRDVLILTQVPGIGPGRLRTLLNHFHDPSKVFHASPRDLVHVDGIEKKTAALITNFFRRGIPAAAERYADQQLSRLNKSEGFVLTLWDKGYPENLRKIYDPPPLLFYKGTLSPDDRYSIAIVGTRSPSPYGASIAEKLVSGLARLGIPIVSGLARGIDTITHTVALQTHGRTVGVIGSGIDVVYPPENRSLFERMSTTGAVVSEFDMGAKPDAVNFPRRNRIISGMSLGTVVVETGVDGGAMITASTALDQNREVFAVPSAVVERRKSGTNLLIKEGKAAMVESVDDILAILGNKLKHILSESISSQPRTQPELSLFEQKLFDAISDEPTHIDALADRSGLATSDALVHLLSLEFKGIVRQMRGKMFVRI